MRCPLSTDLKKLNHRMRDLKFVKLKRWRAKMEVRIAMLRRGSLSRPIRPGFLHRELALAWGVLTHDLSVLALPSEVLERIAKSASFRGLLLGEGKPIIGISYEFKMLSKTATT